MNASADCPTIKRCCEIKRDKADGSAGSTASIVKVWWWERSGLVKEETLTAVLRQSAEVWEAI
jgi:hypothetical protein